MDKFLLGELEIIARLMSDPAAADRVRELQRHSGSRGGTMMLYELCWVGIVPGDDPLADTVVLPKVVEEQEPAPRRPRWWRRRRAANRQT